MRRRTGLTALFWRYLLVTGGAVVLLAVGAYFIFFVGGGDLTPEKLSAYTA